MSTRKMFMAAMAVGVIGVGGNAWAADGAEDFEGLTTGATLAGQNSWTVESGTATVQAGGLDYVGGTLGDEVAGYGISGGAVHLQLGNGATEGNNIVQNTTLATSGTSETKYYSYVTVLQDTSVTQDSDTEVFFRPNNAWSDFSAVKQSGGAEARVGNNAFTAGTWSGSGTTAIHTVGAYEFDGSGNAISHTIWINPDPTISLASQAFAAQNLAGTVGPTSLDTRIRAQNTASTLFDNWVIGGTEAEVSSTAFKAADFNRDGFVDGSDVNTLLANFGGTGKKFSEADADNDALGSVDGSDINILLATFGTDPGPVSAGTAAAEYDANTGGIVVSVNDVASWVVKALDGSLVMTGDAPSGLTQALITDNDASVGEGSFGGNFSYTDLDLGNVAQTGLADGALIIEWNTGFGDPTQTATVSVIPEPASLALLGLGGLCLLGRRKRAA